LVEKKEKTKREEKKEEKKKEITPTYHVLPLLSTFFIPFSAPTFIARARLDNVVDFCFFIIKFTYTDVQ
jgi:hypothetical protein